MRIALITPGFSAGEDDWCIPALLNLVRELARDHEVHVFTLRYPHRRERYSVFGATVHSFGGAAAAGIRRLPLLGHALAYVVAWGHRRPFDVIHALWADEPGFLAVAAGRLLGVAPIVSLMGGELVGLPEIGYGGQLSRAGRWLIRRALAGARRITTGSIFLHRIAEQHADPARLALLPLGVDTRLFHPIREGGAPGPLVDGRIKLLHVASLSPVKDQATLLRALALASAHDRRLHLHIAGAGPLAPRLSRLARSLGIAGHVTFHGAVAHERLPDYYRAADLCVLSSRYESQSMVALEAAACAKPTVGTAVGLLPELAPAASAVAVGDARALAAALLAAVASPAGLAAMGQAGLEQVTLRYTLEHTAARLVELYKEGR